jgi:hypothetical protein
MASICCETNGNWLQKPLRQLRNAIQRALGHRTGAHTNLPLARNQSGAAFRKQSVNREKTVARNASMPEEFASHLVVRDSTRARDSVDSVVMPV